MTENGDLLDKIVGEWARAKIQKMDIMNHNGAMLAYTDKAKLANLLGLTQDQKLGVTPFPSPTNIAINSGSNDSDRELVSRLEQLSKGSNGEPVKRMQTPSTKSDWWKYLLAAAAASGITVGGMSLNNIINKPPDPTQGSVSLDMEGFPINE